MRPIELAGDFDGVELRTVGESLTHRRGAPSGWPGFAQVDRHEITGPSRRNADDGVGKRKIAELHFDGAIGQQRCLKCHGPGGIEAADAAPGHGVLILSGIGEDAPAGAGIEVSQERRDAWRTGKQPRDVAIGARAVLLLEGDVAV